MFGATLFAAQSAFAGGGIIICSPRNHKVCVTGGTSDTETSDASTGATPGTGPTAFANTALGSCAINRGQSVGNCHF